MILKLAKNVQTFLALIQFQIRSEQSFLENYIKEHQATISKMMLTLWAPVASLLLFLVCLVLERWYWQVYDYLGRLSNVAAGAKSQSKKGRL